MRASGATHLAASRKHETIKVICSPTSGVELNGNGFQKPVRHVLQDIKEVCCEQATS